MFYFLHQKHDRHSERGFSMVEMTVVVSIVVIVIGTAIFILTPAMKTSNSNAGLELVVGELRRAHERAVD